MDASRLTFELGETEAEKDRRFLQSVEGDLEEELLLLKEEETYLPGLEPPEKMSDLDTRIFKMLYQNNHENMEKKSRPFLPLFEHLPKEKMTSTMRVECIRQSDALGDPYLRFHLSPWFDLESEEEVKHLLSAFSKVQLRLEIGGGLIFCIPRLSLLYLLCELKRIPLRAYRREATTLAEGTKTETEKVTFNELIITGKEGEKYLDLPLLTNFFMDNRDLVLVALQCHAVELYLENLPTGADLNFLELGLCWGKVVYLDAERRRDVARGSSGRKIEETHLDLLENRERLSESGLQIFFRLSFQSSNLLPDYFEPIFVHALPRGNSQLCILILRNREAPETLPELSEVFFQEKGQRVCTYDLSIFSVHRSEGETVYVFLLDPSKEGKNWERIFDRNAIAKKLQTGQFIPFGKIPGIEFQEELWAKCISKHETPELVFEFASLEEPFELEIIIGEQAQVNIISGMIAIQPSE